MACTQINPGIQVGTQDKDFGAISFNQSLVSSVAQANRESALSEPRRYSPRPKRLIMGAKYQESYKRITFIRCKGS